MAQRKIQAADEFRRWSDRYDRSIFQWLLFGPSHRAMLASLRARFGDRPVKILDVGCGTGVFAAHLLATFTKAQVWGVDLVAGMLRGGRERWRRHRGHLVPVQGDSERLPFASGSFDVVTCANSFHHYPHQDRALAEMHRVLRPGGRLLLLDAYRDRPFGWFLYDVCIKMVEGDIHHNSRAEFRDRLGRAGFQQIQQRIHRGYMPFLLNEAVAGTVPPARTPHAGAAGASQPAPVRAAG
ncbi:MAG: class I SAM-dependent methyltransferase [Isosphaeraceae bacterium]|nr:class I SAM-dependent methyltransferase [Isosphaeraceae bacterium]